MKALDAEMQHEVARHLKSIAHRVNTEMIDCGEREKEASDTAARLFHIAQRCIGPKHWIAELHFSRENRNARQLLDQVQGYVNELNVITYALSAMHAGMRQPAIMLLSQELGRLTELRLRTAAIMPSFTSMFANATSAPSAEELELKALIDRLREPGESAQAVS